MCLRFQIIRGLSGLENGSCIASGSKYRDRLARKGATLFTLWTGQTHRPTKDLDLLGRGLSPTIEEVEKLKRRCVKSAPLQETTALSSSVNPWRVPGSNKKTNTTECALSFRRSWPEREFHCRLTSVFGDAVHPEPELATFPVLLQLDAPLIRAYPREAVIAEKFHAVVVLDIRNSRMNDFYDIWFMANTWEFEMKPVPEAFLSRSQTVFWMTAKRKCNGLHSSTVWMPARRGQLSQKSVRLFAVFFCRAFQKNQSKNQARWNPTHHWH